VAVFSFWEKRYHKFLAASKIFDTLEINVIARTPPVSAVPTETPIYGYLKVPKIPSIKSELVVSTTN
jgi:hypothetical protein